MESIYYTLQDFLTHTESITYLLIIGSLIGITWFWCFLTGNDERR